MNAMMRKAAVVLAILLMLSGLITSIIGEFIGRLIWGG